jgi:hypothetical protein
MQPQHSAGNCGDAQGWIPNSYASANQDLRGHKDLGPGNSCIISYHITCRFRKIFCSMDVVMVPIAPIQFLHACHVLVNFRKQSQLVISLQ